METDETSLSTNDTPTTNICFYSSFVFLFNAFIAHQYNSIIYSVLFAGLFVTSIIFHSNRTPTTKTIDQVFVALIILYGFYQFVIKMQKNAFLSAFAILTFVIVNYLYFSTDYCSHADANIGDMYHSLLHVISSIGHITIIIM